jgi:hypothetical protein
MKLTKIVILLCCVFAIGCDTHTTDGPTETAPANTQETVTRPRDTSPPQESNMTQSGYELADVYTDLRIQVLQLDPDAMGHIEADQSTVIAVLMETGYPEAIATLVAVSDGTSSLYFSNGGGIIGAGEHEPVRKVCGEFLALTQDYVSKSSLTDSFPLPKLGSVRCYLVTRAGVYSFESPEDDLGYDRHPCSPLFHKGHELISAIRENTPD